MRVSQTKTITAQNTFTDWVQMNGSFQIHITGIAGGSIVTLQFTKDNGVTVYDIQTFNADTFYTGLLANTTWKYRAGIKTSEFGSGTVIVSLEA